MAKELNEAEVEALDRGECPDCGAKRFQEGPCAGVSMNIRCAVCGSRFNVIPGCPGSFGKERIGEETDMADATEPKAPLIQIHAESYGGPMCPECGSDYPRRFIILGPRRCVNPNCLKHTRGPSLPFLRRGAVLPRPKPLSRPKEAPRGHDPLELERRVTHERPRPEGEAPDRRPRDDKCPECDGSGVDDVDGDTPLMCMTCQGSGHRRTGAESCPFCGDEMKAGHDGAYVHPDTLRVTTDSKEMARRNRDRCVMNGAVILSAELNNWNRRAYDRRCRFRLRGCYAPVGSATKEGK